MMGTADYGDIVAAVEQVMAGEDCTHFSDINGAVEELPRVLSTPALPRAAPTAAPTASFLSCGAATAAAPWSTF